MKRFVLAASVLVGLLCPGTGIAQDIPDTANYEKILREMILALKDMTKALKQAEDVTTVETPRLALRMAVARFVKVRQEAEEKELPSPEQRKQLVEKYQEKLALEMQALRAEIGRVQRIPGGRKLLEELIPLNPKKPKKSDTMK